MKIETRRVEPIQKPPVIKFEVKYVDVSKIAAEKIKMLKGGRIDIKA